MGMTTETCNKQEQGQSQADMPGPTKPSTVQGFLIAAPMSGSGKTLISTGLMAALRTRGFRVRPFKVGPDYIDPLHHLALTGHVSHNLDAWMLGEQGCRELFSRCMSRDTHAPDKWALFLGSADGAELCQAIKYPQTTLAQNQHYTSLNGRDIAVVESAMGLFDGISGASNACSGAEMALWLKLPVVLVMDARSSARTAAAMIRGLHTCEPDIPLSAVIFNKVSSPNHAAMIREAMECMLPGLPVLGFLPHEDSLRVRERHLGLTLPGEQPHTDMEKLAVWIEKYLDLEQLLKVAQVKTTGLNTKYILSENTPQVRATISEKKHIHSVVQSRYARLAKKTRLAVARDEAFRFFYAENLRLLEKAGAELVPFSPLRDSNLPPNTQGLYLCGGYPELFAFRLSQNKPMLESLAGFINSGGPTYAECGGMLYLGCALTTAQQGETFAMAGILPVHFAMDTKRRGLGYRTARLLQETCLGPAGTTARGHEFHYSYALESPTNTPALSPLFAISNRENKSLGTTGYIFQNAAASYIHLHFGSCPGMAEYFVKYCAAF